MGAVRDSDILAVIMPFKIESDVDYTDPTWDKFHDKETGLICYSMAEIDQLPKSTDLQRAKDYIKNVVNVNWNWTLNWDIKHDMHLGFDC